MALGGAHKAVANRAAKASERVSLSGGHMASSFCVAANKRPTNGGDGRPGPELNYGWNCVQTKNGWSALRNSKLSQMCALTLQAAAAEFI